jgi:hypothetical protein
MPYAQEPPMKHFMIRYRRTNGSEEAWHQEIARFIAALDSDPAVKGKISYRCMKRRDGTDYFHIAGAADDQAVKALQQSAFFPQYNEHTKRIAGGEVEVIPLETIAETAFRS